MIEGQRINFKLLGNWSLAKEIVANLKPDLKESYRQGQRNFAQQIERRVKAHIRNQDLPWAPLAERTVKMKNSQDIYIESKSYYDAIKTYSSGPYQVSVGVKPNAVKLSEGKDGTTRTVNIAMYAAINEFGHTFENGRRVPKRPLWAPTMAELGGKRGMALAVMESFNKVMARKRTSQYFEVLKTKTVLRSK
jgi:hypothetical protein